MGLLLCIARPNNVTVIKGGKNNIWLKKQKHLKVEEETKRDGKKIKTTGNLAAYQVNVIQPSESVIHLHPKNLKHHFCSTIFPSTLR
jgi:hypothetical protein